MEAALAALSRRSRFTAEMRRHLGTRGYPPEEIEATLARLLELGYLDDARHAAAVATRVAAERGWGPRRVRQELARRGVSGEIIDRVLAGAEAEGSDPSRNLERVLAKLLRSRGRPSDRRERDRLRAALMRRGFSPDEIGRALAALDAEAANDDWERQ
jgi:regulatory protein